MKINLIICFLILTLTTGCSLMQKDETKNSEKEVERSFIELTYLMSMDDAWYRMRNLAHNVLFYKEFTWWNHYSVDDIGHLIWGYDFDPSEYVDMTKYDLIISFGHKLKYLYYYKDDYYEGFYGSEENYYQAYPVFEGDYIHRSAYVYIIDKIDLANSELASGEKLGKYVGDNIPFELPVED